MKPEAVVTPLQMGVPFGRRSPHVRGPYSMPNHSQVAEMQIRAAILNRFTALRRPKTQRVE